MRYFTKSLFAISVAVLSACSVDNDNDTVIGGTSLPTKPMTFTATLGEGDANVNSKLTRTELSADNTNPYPVWSAGDQIKVLNTTTSNTAIFDVATEDVGKRAAAFSGKIDVEKDATNSYYALYANNFEGENAPTITSSGSKVTISGSIPSVQTVSGFHADYHFMTACTTGTAFRFKNAMSILKFVVTENDYETFKLCKVYIKSNTGAPIAGNFTANFKTDGDGVLENYQISNGSDMITICDGTKPIEVGTYYIAVLPFTGGFTLKIEDERDGNLKEYQRVSTKDVAASKEINLGSYSARAVAKEAYVDLGLPTGTKWCIENVYDQSGETVSVPTGVAARTTSETSPSSSFYAWGETYVKDNQYKEADCQNYSWYYTYGFTQGSNGANSDEEAGLTRNSQKRSYKYGIGRGGLLDALYSAPRYRFNTSNDGVLLKYNDTSQYDGNIADWGGGKVDNLQSLDFVDDAVNLKAKLSSSVCMPTPEQFEELYSLPIKKDGNNYKITGTNGRYILLPIGGYKYKTGNNDNQDKDISTACYWTKTRTNVQEEIARQVILVYPFYRSIYGYQDYNAKSCVITGDSNGSGSIVDAARCQGRMLRGVVK